MSTPVDDDGVGAVQDPDTGAVNGPVDPEFEDIEDAV